MEVVRAGLVSVTSAAVGNRVYCNNDLAGGARIVFIDVSGDEVTIGPMPPGGTATRTVRRVADQPGYGAEPTRRRRNAPSRH